MSNNTFDFENSLSAPDNAYTTKIIDNSAIINILSNGIDANTILLSSGNTSLQSHYITSDT